jgi:hypothetical protein
LTPWAASLGVSADGAGLTISLFMLIQGITQSVSSAVVVGFSGSDPGMSMAVTMIVCSIATVLAYGGIARPAETNATLVSGQM